MNHLRVPADSTQSIALQSCPQSQMGAGACFNYRNGSLLAAVALGTTPTVVSALALSISSIIGHDFVNWLKARHAGGRQEVWITRLTAVVVAIQAIALLILARGVYVAIPVILAICVAASVNLPILIQSLFWPCSKTGGVISGIAAGLTSSAVLAMIGRAMRGNEAI